MIYYIFGGSKSKIKTSAKKAVLKAENIDFCVETFQKYTNEMRYNHMYMVADYGMTGNAGLFRRQKIDPRSSSNIIPFFIIMEYHIGDDRSMTVRADHTEIYHKRGFTQKFENNLAAAKCFENCLNRNEMVEFSIHYQQVLRKENNELAVCEFERIIVSTQYLNIKKHIGIGDNLITRFLIQSPNWDFLPIKEYSGRIDMDLKKFPTVEEKKSSPISIINFDHQPAQSVVSVANSVSK